MGQIRVTNGVSRIGVSRIGVSRNSARMTKSMETLYTWPVLVNHYTTVLEGRCVHHIKAEERQRVDVIVKLNIGL
ncbi:hypothetical protein QQ214_000468 [Vibrio parahaemolyticus]|nr:hypothetical protein [Vibrio parahaemolyticus]